MTYRTRFRHALTLCSLLLPLTGCVPAALIIGATAGGALVYDKRSVTTMTHDQTAEQQAQRWLNYDPVLKKQAHISVAVFNQVGLLVGQAQTADAKNRASEIMAHIKHVKRTYNEITLSGETSELQRTNDTWLTSKIRTKMLAKKGLNSNDIKVVTEDGVVYLMGYVTHRQAALATDVARRTSGVKKVVKIFEYA